jgi:hypothetical protein
LASSNLAVIVQGASMEVQPLDPEDASTLEVVV